MKIVAFFLIGLIFYLSAFSGAEVKCAPVKKMSCPLAKQHTCKADKQSKPEDDCEQGTCTLLFSCNFCGFLPVEPLKLNPPRAYFIFKPVELYKIGRLTGYVPPNWKPPKIC